MATTYLTYPLNDGYLHNWLVAGPVATPVSPAPAASPQAEVTAVLQTLHQPESGVTEPPVELGPLGDGADTHWRYYRCRDDHFVDFTAAQPVYVHLRAWAYAQVTAPVEQYVPLVLTTCGPADVWVNGQHLTRVEHVESRPRSITLSCALQAGPNEILVRFETAGVGDVPFTLALRLEGLTGATVRLPVNFEPDLLEKRLGLETLAYAGTLDRYVYGYFDGDRYDKNEQIDLRFPAGLPVEGELTFRLQSLQGDIFQERTPKVGSNTVVPLARTFPLRGGPHHLATTPVANDYYIKQLRFDRKELFYVARTAYTVKAGATLKARRQEALDDASKRRSGTIATELAKMALGQMDKLEPKVLTRVLAGLEVYDHHGAVLDLLAGLVAVRRFAKKKPRLNREFRVAVEAAAARYIYQPADYSDTLDSRDFADESRQIVYHACEILAGQLLPDRTFEVTEQTGAWHRERGEAAALAWLRKRGAYGFAAWHSPAGMEEVIAALAVLIDLADSEAVSELAAVLLDKVLFGLAVNSIEGAYGASRGQTDTGSVLSARLEPTSGLQRLLWGRGNFNEHGLGVVCLALCRKYEVPEVIARIATTPVEAFWSRERHTDPARSWTAETATYKTRDFMLASAQGYAPGMPGQAEHVWQATLGPDAVVFVNHPANTSVEDAHRPNFWVGNGLLPHVGQWGDVLIALHQLPEDDWLGYTHAYFPTTAFDEYAVEGQWAFARKGTGYLALRAENGLQVVTSGSTAFRELRSPGAANAWLCHMGQALLDGAFAQFREKVKALEVAVDGSTVRAQTLRGDRLELGWAGPLLINGEAQPLAPERHIENLYCVADLPAAVMEIVAEGGGVRLKFE